MNAAHVYLLISFLSLIFAICNAPPPIPLTLALYFSREAWLPHIPTRASVNNFFTRSTAYIPIPRFRPGSFATDLEDGFSSATFDLSENILGGDTRAGLDDNDKTAISRIMAVKKVGFDEARRILAGVRMEKNGIDPRTGRPLDPRAVFFS
jgi:Fungal protein of unknown function (DUF2015)